MININSFNPPKILWGRNYYAHLSKATQLVSGKMQTVVGRIMAPIRVSIPCEYGSLYGIKGFASVITFRILRWGDHPGLSGWSQCDHRGLIKERGRGKRVKEGRSDHRSRGQSDTIMLALKM